MPCLIWVYGNHRDRRCNPTKVAQCFHLLSLWWDFGRLGNWGSGNLGIWASGYLGIWETGRLGIWASWCLGIWVSGNLYVWVSRNSGVWVTRNLGNCVFGYLGILASGLLGIWKSGYLGIWASRNWASGYLGQDRTRLVWCFWLFEIFKKHQVSPFGVFYNNQYSRYTLFWLSTKEASLWVSDFFRKRQILSTF